MPIYGLYSFRSQKQKRLALVQANPLIMVVLARFESRYRRESPSESVFHLILLAFLTVKICLRELKAV
jgi:hypothetical protein